VIATRPLLITPGRFGGFVGSDVGWAIGIGKVVFGGDDVGWAIGGDDADADADGTVPG
jgi:hypothetical protein